MARFKLTVKKIERVCDFELCWGKGQTLSAQLEYPNLQRRYDQWQQAYLSFYRHLRGKLVYSGSFAAPPPDRYSHLRCQRRQIRSRSAGGIPGP